MHPFLQRQLRKTGCDPDAPPDAQAWRSLLTRLDDFYRQVDKNRALHTRSLEVCSEEMRQLVRAAQRERERVVNIVGALEDGVAVLDGAGRLVFLNAAARRALGIDADDVEGEPLIAALRDAALHGAEQLRESLARCAEDQRAQAVEGTLSKRSGTEERLYAWKLRRLSEAFDAGAWLLTLRDITEQRLADADRNVRASLFACLAAGASMQETLCELLRVVESHIPGMRGRVIAVDHDRGVMEHLASISLPREYLEALPRAPLGKDVTSCGAAICEKRLCVTEDVERDPRWGEFAAIALQHGVRSAWSQPILGARGEALGVVCLTSPTRRTPNAQEALILEHSAQVAAMAIERHHRDELVKENEARFRNLFELSADALFIHDMDGVIVDVNKQACESLGYSRDELLRMRVWDFEVEAPPETCRLLLESLRRGQTPLLEGRHRARDGSEFPVEVRVSLLEDADGPLMLASARNVAKRKEAERALRLTQKSVDLASDAVFWCRPDGSFAYVNQAACRRYGYSREELLKLRVWDVSETMTRERYANWWKTFASRGEDRLGAEHRTKDGHVFPVEVSANLVRFDNEEYSATIVRDMTAHQQAMEAIKQSEQRFRRIFEASHDAIVMVDVETMTVVDVNPAAVALLGYDEEELRGMPVSRIHPDETTEVERFVQAVLRDGKAHTSELSCLRKDGDRVFADISGSLLHSEEGAPLLLAIVRDATEARKAMAALRRAKQQAEAASRSKSEFLANMSHEIRTPLTAIMGYADLLVDPALDAAELASHVKTIKRNGQHLLSLINDILDLSRIESGRMVIERVRCSPAQVVAEVMSLLQVRAVEKGLALCAEMQPPLPETIETDPTRLRQILLNLVGNAVKFTETGGVRVVVRLVEGAETDEPALAFDVVDTGPGMDKAMLERIWKPFEQGDSTTTRKHGGTGLGLAISRRLAEALGGTITVQSQPGQGSVFTLTIATGPLRGVRMLYEDAFTTFAASRSDRSDAADKASGGVSLQGRILLVEDSPDNQRLISFLLKQAGAEVDIACNGREAVEMALRSEQQARPYGLILMDMQMPELDGYAATAQLRSKGWRRPVVALTAHAMAGDQERCLAAGCDDYATKPIARLELLELCARHLQCERTPSEAA